MLIAGKSVRFFKKHTERLFGYSKTAAISSFGVFAYSFGTIGVLIVALIYILEPPAGILTVAVELFTHSLAEVTALILFTIIIRKIDLLAWMSHLDPHDDHPILDCLIGIPIGLGGAVGLAITVEQLEEVASAGFSEGIDFILEVLILVGITSLVMICAAITVNGGCRVLSNVLSGLLVLRRIREVPTLTVQWYRRHLTQLSYFADSCRLVRVYAVENDVSIPRAMMLIFQHGLEQTEPIDHTLLAEVSSNSEESERDPEI